MTSLNPLDQINPLVIVFTIVVATVTMLALKKVFVAPYVAVMEQREKRLEAAELVIDEARTVTAEAEPQAAAIVVEARGKAETVLQQARQESDTYRRQAIDGANEKAAHILEDGRRQIAEEREEELSSLRQRAVECVTTACGKLLGKPDQGAAEAAVDRLLSKRLA